MSGVIEESVCLRCGSVIWVEYDIDVTQLTACECDKFETAVWGFLKKHNLTDDFKRFLSEKEEEDYE